MSILIKGIDMPKENAICVVIFPDGEVTSQFGVPHLGTAVPILPHGRLIDADALDSSLGIDDRDDWVHWTLEDAPTIIPAEEEEK